MLSYLRALIRERTTWAGLPILIGFAVLLWIYRLQVYQSIGASIGVTVGAVMVTLRTDAQHRLISCLRLPFIQAVTAAPPKEPTMNVFETLKDDVVAAETAAVKDAEAAIAATRSQAGQAAISAAIATLPEADQPLGRAIMSAAADPSPANLASVVADAYALLEAAKALPPAAAPVV